MNTRHSSANTKATTVIIFLLSCLILLATFWSVNAQDALPGFINALGRQQSSAWSVHSHNSGDEIAMITADNGWMVRFRSKEARLFHWNGAEWKEYMTIQHPQYIVRGDIKFNSANDGWLMLGGPLDNEPAQTIVYRWSGKEWHQSATLTDPNAISIDAMDFISANEGWATGGFNFGSHFSHWNGSEWKKHSSIWLPAEAGNDIDMLSSYDGWAIGFLGHIFHWDGNVWHEVQRPVTTSLNAISMLSDKDGWIVGDKGIILHWNGVKWSQVASPTTFRLNALAMLSPTDGWAVGGGWNGQDSDPGIILHWDGTAWEKAATPDTAQLNDIAMLSAADGWIVGNTAMLRYETLPPTLDANYVTGVPGSFFTFTGSNYPQDSAVKITVNGSELGDISTDENGTLNFQVSTTEADEGAYFVTAGTDLQVNAAIGSDATASFVLTSDEPFRSQEGTGPIFPVPKGIALTESVFLPGVFRQ